MNVRLIMFKDNGERKEFVLEPGKTVIGRKGDCDLRIPLGEISREHAVVIVDEKTVTLRDLGSSNGTYVNNKRMAEQEYALLHNYLIVGALLFGIGMIGFLSRRNMILMFLSAEMMLQGVSVSLVAWGRFHNDFGGQMLVVFIIAVAACEAAIALALILVLFRRRGSLDIVLWHDLREAD